MADPIAQYFAQYPDYNYYPSSYDWRQIGAFNSLVAFKGWDQTTRKVEYEKLKATWTTVVEAEYSGSTLQHYQNLCDDLGINPIPGSVNECKRQLAGVFVNIVDLTQYRMDRRAGRGVSRPLLHNDLEASRNYSNREKKWYPTENARSEMLRILLKVLH
jgi:hypothetical protein